MHTVEGDTNKRDLDYRDDYDLTSLTMGPMTPLGDHDCFSDTQSDSGLSSSSNSTYDLSRELAPRSHLVVPFENILRFLAQVVCSPFREFALQSPAAVNRTLNSLVQVSFQVRRISLLSPRLFGIPLCQRRRRRLVND